MNIKYLFVADDEPWRNAIVEELRRSPSSTEVLVADNCEDALTILEQETDIDLVVLDLIFKSTMQGMEALGRIRTFSNVLVVIFSTDSAPERQTEAIKAGADAYMDKETFKSEIQARLHLETFLNKNTEEV